MFSWWTLMGGCVCLCLLFTQNPQLASFSEPDFDLHVNTSNLGYGAFFKPTTDSLTETKSIKWIQTRWAAHLRRGAVDEDTFLHLYAVTSALVTWREHLQNTEVLCLLEHRATVDFINLCFTYNTYSGRHANVCKVSGTSASCVAW